MTMEYIIGLAIGILAALVFWFVIQRFYRGSWAGCRSKYDERQKAAQGIAYRNGFWTIVVFLVIWMCLLLTDIPLLPTEVMIVLSFFLGLVVYVVSCIMLDAYMGLNDKPIRWAIICIGIMLLNFGCAVMNYLHGGTSWLNLMCGIMMAVVLIAMGIKTLMSRGKELEEDEEE